MKNQYVAPNVKKLTLVSEEILSESPNENDNEGNLGDLLRDDPSLTGVRQK